MPTTSAFDLVKSNSTCTSAPTPTQAQRIVEAQSIVILAEASGYVTMASFTMLIWDHLCTFKEEVELLWPAPRSLIKFLFLWNRYTTLIFMAVTVYEMSRLQVFSDTFCKVWVVVKGIVEITSIAISDLQLLYRIHALWGGCRSIVVGTLTLDCILYVCMAAVAIVTAVDIVPHLYFDLTFRQCVTYHKPNALPAQWAVASLQIIRELVVFVLAVIKALQNRGTDQTHTPLMKVLCYDQIYYYIIIVVLRVFCFVVWVVITPYLFFPILFFIWALTTTIVSRIMLHLRRVARTNSPGGNGTSFFGETTQIVWARRNTTLSDQSINIELSSGRRGERV